MPAPLTRAQRARLQAAADHVADALNAGLDAWTIIVQLMTQYGASLTVSCGDTNRLRVAGVTASCTWSRAEGLLTAWRRLATLRLMSVGEGG